MDTVEQARVYARTAYRITLQGSLDERWSDWLDGMAVVRTDGHGAQVQTVSEGGLTDQSALVGVLGVLQGVGLGVLGVEYLGRNQRAIDLKDEL